MHFSRRKSRIRSISETNPVFTVESEADLSPVGGISPVFLPESPVGSPCSGQDDVDISETESGYDSCLSSRKTSAVLCATVLSASPALTAVPNITLTPPESRARSQTSVVFPGDVIATEDLSFDRLSAQRSKRIRSLSVGDDVNSESESGKRRASYDPEALPGGTDQTTSGQRLGCPSDRCYSPALCESFKRGPSLGFRQDNAREKRERSFSACSDYTVTSGVNVSLHNVIGKKGHGNGQFRNATSVSHVSSGSIIVTDIINCRVTLFHGSGRVISELQTGPGSEPWATAVLPNGNFVVSLQKPGCLAIFSPNGDSCKHISKHLLVKPSGVATDRKGRIIVSDVNTDSVYIVDEEGTMLQKLGQEPDVALTFEEPRHVNVTSRDKILVCDSGKHCVYVFDSDGKFLHTFGSYGQDSGQFRFPYGITSDNEENVYVADYYNNRVSMFTISGEFVGHILTPCMKLKRPQGLDIRDGMTDSILYVSHGEMKAHEVVAFKVIAGSKTRLRTAVEAQI